MASDGDDSVPYVTAFGSRVSESEPLTVVLRSGPLTLSNAALSLVHARKQQAPTTLCAKCEGWEESIVLCTLFPTSIPQTMLNVTFAQGNEEVLLSVVGPATIHVTGEMTTFEDMGDEDSGEGSGAGAAATDSDDASASDESVDLPSAESSAEDSDESDLDSDESAEALVFDENAAHVDTVRGTTKAQKAQKAQKKKAKKDKKPKQEATQKAEPTAEAKKRKRPAEDAAQAATADNAAGAAPVKLTRAQKRRLKKKRQRLAESGAASAAAAAEPAKAFKPSKTKVVAHKSGLAWVELEQGLGKKPTLGKVVCVQYKGSLASGQMFDAGKMRFRLGTNSVIKGFDMGVAQGMRVGGSRRLFIPAKLGYGSAGAAPKIPPNADLVFEVTLLSAK